MSKEDQIRLYLERTPPAISGQGGHNRTLAVARTLFNGFNLSETETLDWLKKFNQRCDPEWKERELIHKVKSAAAGSYDKSRGWMMGESHANNGNGKLIYEKKERVAAKADFSAAIDAYLSGFRCSEAELLEASPIKPSEDYENDAPLLVSHLFLPGEEVNYITKYTISTRKETGETRADPSGYGTTLERDSLLRNWAVQGIAGTEAGGWLRINPVHGGIGDENVTAFRTALMEFDKTPLDLQLSFCARVPLPITAILTSGGRSIHSLVRVDAGNSQEYEAAFNGIKTALERFGMDTKNRNPSRLSRLPGLKRTIGADGDGRQRLLYLNPNPDGKAILT